MALVGATHSSRMPRSDGGSCCCGAVPVSSAVSRRRVRLLVLGGACVAASCGLVAQMTALVTPDHWCRDAYGDALQKQLPLLPQEVRQFTIPARRGPDGFEYSQCHRFEGDAVAAYLQWVIKKKPLFSNSSSPEISCDQGWHYNLTGSFHTISTEMNWVCSNAWKTCLVHVLFYLFATLGVYVWHYIAQRCGTARALLLASGLGATGVGASLAEPSSLTQVVAAYVISALTLLSAPLLALRAVVIEDEKDRSEVVSTTTSTSNAQRLAAVVLVLQSACTVMANVVAVFFPHWWLSAAALTAFAVSALLQSWDVLVSSTCIVGRAKILQVPSRDAPDESPFQHLESVIRYFTLLACGAAYFGLWLFAPCLIPGPPVRAAALLAAAESAMWPLLWVTTAAAEVEPKRAEREEGPAPRDGPSFRRIVACCSLSVTGVLLTMLGVMRSADNNCTLIMALVARASATIAIFCSRHEHLSAVTAKGAGKPNVFAGETMVGVGAILSATLVWLGQETTYHFTLIILGIVVTLGASCDMWISVRPLYHRVDYWCGYMRTSIKFTVSSCTTEGRAKFENSSLPYGTLENV